MTAELSMALKEQGMLGYVRLVQQREKELGVDVLRHQKWSGAEYLDGILGVIQTGSSGTRSMGEGNTEAGQCHRSFNGVMQDSSLYGYLRLTNLICRL